MTSADPERDPGLSRMECRKWFLGPSAGILFVPFAIAPLLLAVPSATAQTPSPPAGTPLLGPEAEPHHVPRIDEPIELDGNVNKAVWQEIAPLSTVVHTPDFGAIPSEPTEWRMAHDGEYLYVSCLALDSEPELIQASSYRRNDSSFNSDRCSVYLDTLNDEETALGFGTTPAGIRTDLTFVNDAQGPPNFDWNSFWDVVVTRDDTGWHAEFRIPFSSLIFQEEDGSVEMGFSLLRTIARRNEMTTHPAMSPQYGFSSFGKPSRMRKLTLDGVQSSRPVYLTPYVLGGTRFDHNFSPGDNAYLRDSERTVEAGFDLRTSLTSNLTLDLTFNTDFAQVEADDQQVNLSRFPLFFPEKRRFFQERGVLFEYSLGGQERLFHSRRVGLVDGIPVRIYGGARLVGRVGEWDVGVLNMQTADSEVAPSENQGVVRLRRRVLNPNSYVGGIVTSRTGSGGEYNVVYALDAVLRVVGDDYLTINSARSHDHRLTDNDSFLDNSFLRLDWSRRSQDFLSYSVSLARRGSTFEPEMGFIRRQDYTQVGADLGYGWRRTGPEHRVIRTSIGASGSAFLQNTDDKVESGDMTIRASMEMRSGRQWTLTVPHRYEFLQDHQPFPEDTFVPAGEHRFTSVRLQYQPPQSAFFRPSVTLEAGEFYDGRQASLTLSPTWSVSRNFSLGGHYRVDHVTFQERDQSFTAHVARLRGEVMFSTRTSIVTFVQYNHTANAVVANFRFRYNPREGNDFYIVWNEGLITDGESYDPARRTIDSRAILIKYSHTLHLGF